MAHRCRLCTANDDEALVDRLAQDLWRGLGTELTWDEAEYWRPIYRNLARRAVESLRPSA